MRNGRCPKCGGNRVARTEFVVYMGAGVSGPTIELFACAQCRFCEHYLRGSVEERVAVLDTWTWVGPDGGPFRG